MTDATPSPPDDSANDLESQLESLMKQAREGGGAADATEETEAENAVAVETPPTSEASPGKSDDLASQLDALMAKVGKDETDSSTEPAESSVTEDDRPGTDVIADGPADVEDALDDLQGAFDAVQDVIDEIEGKPEVEPAATHEDPTPEVVASATETTEAPAAEAEPQDDEDDLAAQVQSLLDEASAEEADSFISPEELLNDAAQDEAEDDALDGHFDATVDDVIAEAAGIDAADATDAQATAPAEAQASAEPVAEPEASADDAPLIEQIDSLLADHAEDAISGEFESVDQLLGVSETSGENVADPADDLDEEAEDDGLGGDFQSMDDLLTKPETDEEPEETKAEPSPAASAEPRQEEPSVELDEIDGLFEAPQAISEESAPQASAAEEDVSVEDEDKEADGGFESLDAMLDAPPPSVEDRDGSPPAPPVKAESKTKTKSQTSDDGFKITINLALLQTAAALLLGWTLWACAIVNKPIDKLPDEMKQTVGWVALAVAAPGMLLVVYGLLFN